MKVLPPWKWIFVWVGGFALIPLAWIAIIWLHLSDGLMVLIVPLVIGVLFWAAWRQDTHLDRSIAANRCHRCNYDRRGLDPAAACPECGEKKS